MNGVGIWSDDPVTVRFLFHSPIDNEPLPPAPPQGIPRKGRTPLQGTPRVSVKQGTSHYQSAFAA